MHLRAISKYKAPGGLYLERFLRYKFEGLIFMEGLIHGGDHFWNFTV